MALRRALFVNPPVLAVDAHQVCMYAEAVPFGLVQIATHLTELGTQVQIVDMMGHLDGDFSSVLVPENIWAMMPVGDNRSTERRPVYLYGRDLAWLDNELAQHDAPDVIFVSCSISFNYPPAHAVIQTCKQRFPSARVLFGGPHPTTFVEHAKSSGADEVFVGRYEAARDCFPQLSLLAQRPPIWLFRLVTGCKYNCSFCANATHGTRAAFEPQRVADNPAGEQAVRCGRVFQLGSECDVGARGARGLLRCHDCCRGAGRSQVRDGDPTEPLDAADCCQDEARGHLRDDDSIRER